MPTQQDALGLTTGHATTFDYTSVMSTTIVTCPPTSLNPGWSPEDRDTYDAQGRVTLHQAEPTSTASDNITIRYVARTARLPEMRNARGSSSSDAE